MAIPPQPALLERERELAQLEALLAEARAGTGRLLLVEGVAGLGKTRLLRETRRRADGSGMRVLAARATELERDFPFGVVRQLFEGAVAVVEPNARQDLLAGSASSAGVIVGVESEGPATRDRDSLVDPSFATLNALYWLTSNLAESGPMLLAIDDAHWADRPSLRFLRFLLPRLEDLPLLLAVAARPAEPGAESELLAQLVSDQAAEVVRPRALSETAVGELVRAGLAPAAHDEFCAACHHATAGNPFMLSELIRELAADASPGTAAEAAHVRELAPATIGRAVLVRLGRLPDPAPRLAQAVAVLGDDAEPGQAAELVGIDGGAASEAADVLAAAGILEPGRPWRFIHPLVRNAVYADLPHAELAAAHLRAARLLRERGAESERVAIHLLATDAGADPDVVETLDAAAGRALDRLAPEAAIAYLRRALAESPEAGARRGLLRRLVTASFRAADRDTFEELLGSGGLEELTADSQLLLASADQLAFELSSWGRVAECAALLDRATSAAIEARDYDLVARFESFRFSWTQLPPAEARARFDRYKEHIQPGTPGERAWLALQAISGLLTGESATTVAGLARRALEGGKIWREQPDSAVPGGATYVLRQVDELDAAERAIVQNRSALRTRKTEAPWAIAAVAYARGQLAYLRGDIARAEPDLRAAVETSRQAETPLAFPDWLAALLEVLIERDELTAAEAELDAAEMAGAVPESWWFGPVLFSRARLHLARGRAQEALDDLFALAEVGAKAGVQVPYWPAGSYAALACSALGDQMTARQFAEQELDGARAWGLPRRLGIALRTLGLIEGDEAGLERLREALAVLERSPAKLEYMRTLSDYGALLRRANRRAQARDPLRTAIALARPAGAVAIARRAHGELEATGERLRPLLGAGAESLTPSERRIAEMAAEGQTNRTIAQELFLTLKTVETHLSHTYRKLDISSRRELPEALLGS